MRLYLLVFLFAEQNRLSLAACPFDVKTSCDQYLDPDMYQFSTVINDICYFYSGQDQTTLFDTAQARCDNGKAQPTKPFDYGRMAVFATPAIYTQFAAACVAAGAQYRNYIQIGAVNDGRKEGTLYQYEWASSGTSTMSYIFNAVGELPDVDPAQATIILGGSINGDTRQPIPIMPTDMFVLYGHTGNPFAFKGFPNGQTNYPHVCEYGCGTPPVYSSTPAWWNITASLASTTMASSASTSSSSATASSSPSTSNAQPSTSTSTSTISSSLASTTKSTSACDVNAACGKNVAQSLSQVINNICYTYMGDDVDVGPTLDAAYNACNLAKGSAFEYGRLAVFRTPAEYLTFMEYLNGQGRTGDPYGYIIGAYATGCSGAVGGGTIGTCAGGKQGLDAFYWMNGPASSQMCKMFSANPSEANVTAQGLETNFVLAGVPRNPYLFMAYSEPFSWTYICEFGECTFLDIRSGTECETKKFRPVPSGCGTSPSYASTLDWDSLGVLTSSTKPTSTSTLTRYSSSSSTTSQSSSSTASSITASSSVSSSTKSATTCSVNSCTSAVPVSLSKYAKKVAGVCYLYMRDSQLETFDNGYQACANMAGTSGFAYGRLAVFETPTDYLDLMTTLKSQSVSGYAAIGAYVSGCGGAGPGVQQQCAGTLDKYSWMNGPSSSPMCTMFLVAPNGANLTTMGMGDNFTLAGNPQEPLAFQSMAASVTLSYICELGCGSPPTYASTLEWDDLIGGTAVSSSSTSEASSTTTSLASTSMVSTSTASTSSSSPSASSTLTSTQPMDTSTMTFGTSPTSSVSQSTSTASTSDTASTSTSVTSTAITSPASASTAIPSSTTIETSPTTSSMTSPSSTSVDSCSTSSPSSVSSSASSSSSSAARSTETSSTSPEVSSTSSSSESAASSSPFSSTTTAPTVTTSTITTAFSDYTSSSLSSTSTSSVSSAGPSRSASTSTVASAGTSSIAMTTESTGSSSSQLFTSSSSSGVSTASTNSTSSAEASSSSTSPSTTASSSAAAVITTENPASIPSIQPSSSASTSSASASASSTTVVSASTRASSGVVASTLSSTSCGTSDGASSTTSTTISSLSPSSVTPSSDIPSSAASSSSIQSMPTSTSISTDNESSSTNPTTVLSSTTSTSTPAAVASSSSISISSSTTGLSTAASSETNPTDQSTNTASSTPQGSVVTSDATPSTSSMHPSSISSSQRSTITSLSTSSDPSIIISASIISASETATSITNGSPSTPAAATSITSDSAQSEATASTTSPPNVASLSTDSESSSKSVSSSHLVSTSHSSASTSALTADGTSYSSSAQLPSAPTTLPDVSAVSSSSTASSLMASAIHGTTDDTSSSSPVGFPSISSTQTTSSTSSTTPSSPTTGITTGSGDSSKSTPVRFSPRPSSVSTANWSVTNAFTSSFKSIVPDSTMTAYSSTTSDGSPWQYLSSMTSASLPHEPSGPSSASFSVVSSARSASNTVTQTAPTNAGGSQQGASNSTETIATNSITTRFSASSSIPPASSDSSPTDKSSSSSTSSGSSATLGSTPGPNAAPAPTNNPLASSSSSTATAVTNSTGSSSLSMASASTGTTDTLSMGSTASGSTSTTSTSAILSNLDSSASLSSNSQSNISPTMVGTQRSAMSSSGAPGQWTSEGTQSQETNPRSQKPESTIANNQVSGQPVSQTGITGQGQVTQEAGTGASANPNVSFMGSQSSDGSLSAGSNRPSTNRTSASLNAQQSSSEHVSSFTANAYPSGTEIPTSSDREFYFTNDSSIPESLWKYLNGTPECSRQQMVKLLTQTGFPKESADGMARTTYVQAALPFISSSLTPEIQKQIGMNWSMTFLKCYYSGSDCLVEGDFRWDQTATFGSCFTYNFNDTSVRMFTHPGSQYGMALTLYTNQDDFICTSDSAGFKISLQPQMEAPFPEASGFYAMPGVVTSAIVQRVTNLKAYNCTDNGNLTNYYYNGSYTVEGCLRSCNQRYIIGRCGCADPRFPKPLQTRFCDLDDMMCLENFLACNQALVTRDQCSCRQACRETQYSTSVTTSGINFDTAAWKPICAGNVPSNWTGSCAEYLQKSIAVVNIYYDRLSEVIHSEVDAYPSETYISDTFASMGLYFGICIMTGVEVGLAGLQMIIAALHRCTRFRKLT